MADRHCPIARAHPSALREDRGMRTTPLRLVPGVRSAPLSVASRTTYPGIPKTRRRRHRTMSRSSSSGVTKITVIGSLGRNRSFLLVLHVAIILPGAPFAGSGRDPGDRLRLGSVLSYRTERHLPDIVTMWDPIRLSTPNSGSASLPTTARPLADSSIGTLGGSATTASGARLIGRWPRT